jgi:Trk K+ transport system NAD-binding subunit
MGVRVLEFLRAGGLNVVVIDTVCKEGDPRLAGVRLVVGDCRRREILEEAGVAAARGVLILTNDDMLNVSTALMIRGLNPEVRVVLRMFNQNLLRRLGQAVHNVYALSTSQLTAPMLAMIALTGQGLGAFRLEGQPDSLRQILELKVGPGSGLIGLSVSQTIGRNEAVVLAHLRTEGNDRFLRNVEPEKPLSQGDSLVLCASPPTLASLLASGAEPEPADLQWANWLRRIGRVAWRTFAEMDKMVLACTLVVAGVLLTSTLILHLGVAKYSLPAALFRTVSIMATGGGLGDRDFEKMPRMQVFVSALRILGAVLIAAFTALITNYLLRARLGGALDVRRIPDGGHFVVCGLSTIGFRVLEELIALHKQVVVIEVDASNRFVTTARRLGAAVIVGDCTVNEVLRQAHAGAAHAVLATVNNDMTNLEVALLVRDLNKKQRVVLLMNDPQLALMLREAANVRLALSVPALAAPAFVAGLFGDRVSSVVLVRERIFAVIDMIIDPNDPFLGQGVSALAADYSLQPITLLRNNGPIALEGAYLQPGDRMVAFIALVDLDKLVGRAFAARREMSQN